MNNKLIISSFVLAGLSLGLISAEESENKNKVSGGYSIPCPECKGEMYHTPMWRDYLKEIKHTEIRYNADKKDYEPVIVDGTDCLVYRCKYGHELHVK